MDSIYTFKADSLLSAKVIKEVQNASKAATPQRLSYRVKSGDYLGRIASRYGVSVNQLKNWNNLKSSTIREGQILYIYTNGGPKAKSSVTSSSSSTSSKSSSSSNASNTTYYTVREGDSLYKIAKKYPGVSADNIKAANGLKSDNIRPGQKLKIPL